MAGGGHTFVEGIATMVTVGLLVRLVANFTGPEWAKVIGIAVGSNVLVGFIIAIYAVILSEIVRMMEEAHWRARGRQRAQS